jgi:hypothetical protein
MKARVKLTGEIVEIKDLYDDGTALVNDKYFKVSELDFFSETIDWEQRRYEIAKECVAVLMRNIDTTLEDAAKVSVKQADFLIKRLKENNDE